MPATIKNTLKSVPSGISILAKIGIFKFPLIRGEISPQGRKFENRCTFIQNSSCNMFGDVIRQSGWNTSEVCIAAKQGRLTKFVFFFFSKMPRF